MVLETVRQLQLKQTVSQLNERFEGHAPEVVLSAIVGYEFKQRTAVVSSFGAEAAIILHMISEIDPSTPVIFLDTLKHFPETIEYRDEVCSRLNLTGLRVVTPKLERIAAEDPDDHLCKVNPDACCHLRKTIPMVQALQEFNCWITGRKRVHSNARARIRLFEFQDKWIKVNPLYNWTAQEVNEYYLQHDLPPHPLKEKGYRSIGCAPCTNPTQLGEDARAGRWSGHEKTECGIHIVDGKIVRASAD
ncbi:phosphoadenylyl-sulfate reductase [Roseibium sp. SCP14]|uniref:phosphoadenylyl-sulfate reductase n=1 Tax=Roseibium sp. SCP14 TaxID=3141375 RepID=UPI00333884EC